MVLQQLDINLNGLSTDAVFAPSYDIVPSSGGDSFEVDLVAIMPSRGFRERADIILGECKDQGGVIDRKDIDNLRRAADALPQSRFATYILLAKLSPFTATEIELAKSLNGPYQRRVAGCIITTAGTVAGLSNVFGDASEAISAAAMTFFGRDLVGYGNGDALAAALEVGFRTVGGLVVWRRL
jgi:hypothetical protein